MVSVGVNGKINKLIICGGMKWKKLILVVLVMTLFGATYAEESPNYDLEINIGNNVIVYIDIGLYIIKSSAILDGEKIYKTSPILIIIQMSIVLLAKKIYLVVL